MQKSGEDISMTKIDIVLCLIDFAMLTKCGSVNVWDIGFVYDSSIEKKLANVFKRSWYISILFEVLYTEYKLDKCNTKRACLMGWCYDRAGYNKLYLFARYCAYYRA